MLKINKNLLNKSKQEMYKVINLSPRIRGFKRFTNRRSDFSLLVGKSGFTCFSPQIDIAKEVKSNFKKLISDELVKNYDYKLATICITMIDNITGQEIVANSLKRELKDSINRVYKQETGDAKPYVTSPKLSKLLVKMFGEQSDIVSWFTNSKPTSSTDSDYRVFVSVLPHHIAGMAYYGSANHGGEDWQEYRGTSCQDTLRAGAIKEIQHLPATLLDDSVAIAWITYKNKNNIFSPFMLARTLIRIAYIDSKPIFIACRVFGTSKNTKNALIYALEKKYKGILFQANDVQPKDYTYHSKVELSKVAEYDGYKVEHCPTCNGEGTVRIYDSYEDDYEVVDCEDCDGTGRVPTDEEITFYPYIDDKAVISHNGGNVRYTFDYDFAKDYIKDYIKEGAYV
jgi:hypothetical protein